MASDSDRLLAAGRSITFLDGSTHTLHFGFRALKLIEDDFGSIAAVSRSLDDQAMFGTVARVLTAGLSHEHRSMDELLDLLDVQRLNEYTKATIEALTEALPSVAVDPTRPTLRQRNGKSPGLTTTTSRPFVSVEVTTPSG